MHVHAHSSTLSRFAATDTATATAATVTSSSTATPVASTTDTQATPTPAAHAENHRAHGGHGHLRQALGDALSDLGLELPTGRDKGDHDDDGRAASATGQTRHDLARFMHALFQAVKAEPAAATPAGTGADPKRGFAAGLSALIGEAGNGTAPTSLRQAFDKLMSDLTGSAPAAASPAPAPAVTTGDASTAAAGVTPAAAAPTEPAATPTSEPSSATTAPAATTPSTPPAAVTLQALLSRLQQNLGVYGARNRATDSSVVGNTLNVTA